MEIPPIIFLPLFFFLSLPGDHCGDRKGTRNGLYKNPGSFAQNRVEEGSQFAYALKGTRFRLMRWNCIYVYCYRYSVAAGFLPREN